MPLLLLAASSLITIGMVRLLEQPLTIGAVVSGVVFASITALLTLQISEPVLSLRFFVWAVLVSAFCGMVIASIQFFRREMNDAWAVSKTDYEGTLFTEEAWQG